MTSTSSPSLRARWAAGENTLGAWLSVTNTFTAEATARLDFDYVCIDNQHGINDYAGSTSMIQAILLGGGLPICRAPWNEPGIVGKLLDAGSQAIIAPMVNSAAESEALVRAMRYPPDGGRSWGPLGVALRTGGAQYDRAAEDIAVIPMIETVEALAAVDDIVSVPGVDAVYVGPADLSLSLGLPPRANDGEAAFDEALAAIVAACNRHGVVPGIHATGTLTPKRLEQGFRMVTVTSDMLAMSAGMKIELDRAHGRNQSGSSDAMY